MREAAIAKAGKAIKRLGSARFAEMSAIRLIESECAVAYFAPWADIEMRWSGQNRYPVSEQLRTYRTRTFVLTGRKPKNWKVLHPINAMLDYAYAVKAAHLQIQAVADGFDPHTGIIHHARLGFPVYVCDLVEPERPRVAAAIIAFVQSRTFSGADFVLHKDGA